MDFLNKHHINGKSTKRILFFKKSVRANEVSLFLLCFFVTW